MLSRVTNAASRSSLQPSVPAGRIGTHQKPRLGGRIPDADLGLGRQRHAEIGKDALGIDHRARAVGRRFVPDRRQPQHRPRITGTQGADDEVVGAGRILDRDQVAGYRVQISQRIGRLGRVGQEPALEFGIDPGAGDDPGAVMRPDPGFERLDDLVQCRRIDIALFGQDGLERPHPHLHLGQFRAVGVVVGIGMVVWHRCSPRSHSRSRYMPQNSLLSGKIVDICRPRLGRADAIPLIMKTNPQVRRSRRWSFTLEERARAVLSRCKGGFRRPLNPPHAVNDTI